MTVVYVRKWFLLSIHTSYSMNERVEMSDSLSANFMRMVQAIDEEVASLKLIADLRDVSQNYCPENVKNSLRELEKSLTSLEYQFDNFDSHLEKELFAIRSLENLKNVSLGQHHNILQIEGSIPDFLRIENEGNSVSGPIKSDFHHQKFITMQEFEEVPQSTRSRLTLDEVMRAYQSFCSLIAQKEEVTIKGILLSGYVICDNQKVASWIQRGNKALVDGYEVSSFIRLVYLTDFQSRITVIYNMTNTKGEFI